MVPSSSAGNWPTAIIANTLAQVAPKHPGSAFGFVLARVARSYFADVRMPGLLPVAASAFVLLAVAVVASMLPAGRAARVDVIQALRSE